MAASTSSFSNQAQAMDSGFINKLNTTWHKHALQGFMLIVLAHWAEHLAQAVQVYILGWPRPTANGFWVFGSRGWSLQKQCIMATRW